MATAGRAVSLEALRRQVAGPEPELNMCWDTCGGMVDSDAEPAPRRGRAAGHLHLLRVRAARRGGCSARGRRGWAAAATGAAIANRGGGGRRKAKRLYGEHPGGAEWIGCRCDLEKLRQRGRSSRSSRAKIISRGLAATARPPLRDTIPLLLDFLALISKLESIFNGPCFIPL